MNLNTTSAQEKRELENKFNTTNLSSVRKVINKNTVTLVIDAGSDTQVHIAKDIVDVIEGKNEDLGDQIRVLPVLSKGGAQNALDIMFLNGVDLGIIQTDILAHLRGKNWSLYNNIFKKINFITKLYHAEWHVIGNKKYKNIRGLKGKLVNISAPNSGTNIMSRNIFELLGVKIKYTTYNNEVALEKLKRGEIDAMITVGGAPLNKLSGLTKEDGLHFIPATFFFDSSEKTPLVNVLEHFYFPSYLSHEHYPGLIEKGSKVPTVANGVMLAVYNWDQSKNSARKRKIEKFINRFFAKFPDFTEIGRHPKWKETSLAAEIPEWQRLNQVKKLIKSKN
ncbi:hypothetical protein NBRC116602_22190 [Hyphomicrobiales bacterium 4NK60-0047b]